MSSHASCLSNLPWQFKKQTAAHFEVVDALILGEGAARRAKAVQDKEEKASMGERITELEETTVKIPAVSTPLPPSPREPLSAASSVTEAATPSPPPVLKSSKSSKSKSHTRTPLSVLRRNTPVRV